jgi:hypothetical protein
MHLSASFIALKFHSRKLYFQKIITNQKIIRQRSMGKIKDIRNHKMTTEGNNNVLAKVMEGIPGIEKGYFSCFEPEKGINSDMLNTSFRVAYITRDILNTEFRFTYITSDLLNTEFRIKNFTSDLLNTEFRFMYITSDLLNTGSCCVSCTSDLSNTELLGYTDRPQAFPVSRIVP